jgi:hypothetical protein
MSHEPKGITKGLTWQELGTIAKFQKESRKKRNTKYCNHDIVILGGMQTQYCPNPSYYYVNPLVQLLFRFMLEFD